MRTLHCPFGCCPFRMPSSSPSKMSSPPQPLPVPQTTTAPPNDVAPSLPPVQAPTPMQEDLTIGNNVAAVAVGASGGGGVLPAAATDADEESVQQVHKSDEQRESEGFVAFSRCLDDW